MVLCVIQIGKCPCIDNRIVSLRERWQEGGAQPHWWRTRMTDEEEKEKLMEQVSRMVAILIICWQLQSRHNLDKNVLEQREVLGDMDECADEELLKQVANVMHTVLGEFNAVFMIQILTFFLCTWIFQVAGSLVVSRRAKLPDCPPGSLLVCASKHKVKLVLFFLNSLKCNKKSWV